MQYINAQQFRSQRKYRDGFFHLPTVLAANDPFLRRLYGVVSDVLDDRPYPKNSIEYEKRTLEIQHEISRRHFSTSERKFLNRLQVETGVELVKLTSTFLFVLFL